MKFRELTTKELNANLKSDKLALKESYQNLGKIRAMLLTIDSLAVETKKVLRESKKDSVIYTAINTALWYGINNVSNGNELLKTVKEMQQSIFAYSNNTITSDALNIYGVTLFNDRLTKEIKKAQNTVISVTALLDELTAKNITAPIYGDLVATAEKRLIGANVKLTALVAMQ